MPSDRLVLLLVLAIGATLFACSVFGYASGRIPGQKLLNSSSVALGLASILQLRVSGWFDAVISEFGDESKYPYGPPSYITRHIIDDPDHPFRTEVRNYAFFDANFGAHLAIVSLLLAMFAIWFE